MTDPKGAARRPLRIAEFVDNYGPGSNGLMFAVQQLEGNLLDAGHEVVVVAPAATGPNPHFGRLGRTEIRLPSLKFPRMPTRVASGRRFESTIEALGEKNLDAIHVHGFGPVGVLGVWAAQRLQVPLMLTWHTDFDAYAEHYAAVLPLLAPMAHAFSWFTHGELIDRAELKAGAQEHMAGRGWSEATLIGMCAKMLRSANLVTTPSPKTADRCRQLAPGVDPLVVPTGVDPLPQLAPAVTNPDGKLVIYAGRIAPEKGLGLLAEAFELVATERPGTKLLVVGDYQTYPGIRRALESLEEQGLAILAGEKNREELGAWYASADLFAFPSLSDTQALVLHEAALTGLPIVSVDHELQLVLTPEVNGELTRPTPASLAAGLIRTIDNLDDEAWRTRAQQTSRKLAGQWTVASQAAKMLTLYQEVAGGRHPRQG